VGAVDEPPRQHPPGDQRGSTSSCSGVSVTCVTVPSSSDSRKTSREPVRVELGFRDGVDLLLTRRSRDNLADSWLCLGRRGSRQQRGRGGKTPIPSKFEVRKDPDAARALLVELFPNKAGRNAVLEVFANAVIFAHVLSPDKWGVSLLRETIRLNLGRIEVLTLQPYVLELVLFRPKLPPELRELATGDGYKSVPNSCFLSVDYTRVGKDLGAREGTLAGASAPCF